MNGERKRMKWDEKESNACIWYLAIFIVYVWCVFRIHDPCIFVTFLLIANIPAKIEKWKSIKSPCTFCLIHKMYKLHETHEGCVQYSQFTLNKYYNILSSFIQYTFYFKRWHNLNWIYLFHIACLYHHQHENLCTKWNIIIHSNDSKQFIWVTSQNEPKMIIIKTRSLQFYHLPNTIAPTKRLLISIEILKLIFRVFIETTIP